MGHDLRITPRYPDPPKRTHTLTRRPHADHTDRTECGTLSACNANLVLQGFCVEFSGGRGVCSAKLLKGGLYRSATQHALCCSSPKIEPSVRFFSVCARQHMGGLLRC